MNFGFNWQNQFQQSGASAASPQRQRADQSASAPTGAQEAVSMAGTLSSPKEFIKLAYQRLFGALTPQDITDGTVKQLEQQFSFDGAELTLRKWTTSSAFQAQKVARLLFPDKATDRAFVKQLSEQREKGLPWLDVFQAVLPPTRFESFKSDIASRSNLEELSKQFFMSFLGRTPSDDESKAFAVTYQNASGALDVDKTLDAFLGSKEFLFRQIMQAIGADRQYKTLWQRSNGVSLGQLTQWALQENDAWIAQHRQSALETFETKADKAKSPFLEALGVTISPLGLWGSQE